MAKENKKNPPVEAPVVNKEKKEDKVPATQEIKVDIPGIPQGLDQNHKADMIGYAQHKKDEMLRNNETNVEKYKAFSMMEEAFFLDIAITEAIIKKNPAGCIFTINETNYGLLEEFAKGVGVSLPSYKSLPKPTKEQLKQAGLEAAPGQVILKLEDKNVSKEAKEQKKKEEKSKDNKQGRCNEAFDKETADIINNTKANGGRIICVGTTSCRTIESAAVKRPDGGYMIDSTEDDTEIFIYPGYTFKCIDSLITNFHLPESTLIMLVSALAGRENILNAYQEAIRERYKFFSFGDAMFIE